MTKTLIGLVKEFEISRYYVYGLIMIILLNGAFLKFTGIISIFSYTTKTLNYFLDIRNLHVTYLVQRSERFVLNFRAEENDDVWDTLSEGESQFEEGGSLDGGSSIASLSKRRAGSSAL